jgi:hypothetical protein
LDEFCSLTRIQCQVKLKYERLMTVKKEKDGDFYQDSCFHVYLSRRQAVLTRGTQSKSH